MRIVDILFQINTSENHEYMFLKKIGGFDYDMELFEKYKI